MRRRQQQRLVTKQQQQHHHHQVQRRQQQQHRHHQQQRQAVYRCRFLENFPECYCFSFSVVFFSLRFSSVKRFALAETKPYKWLLPLLQGKDGKQAV